MHTVFSPASVHFQLRCIVQLDRPAGGRKHMVNKAMAKTPKNISAKKSPRRRGFFILVH
jgi:hypothetical protein